MNATTTTTSQSQVGPSFEVSNLTNKDIELNIRALKKFCTQNDYEKSVKKIFKDFDKANKQYLNREDIRKFLDKLYKGVNKTDTTVDLDAFFSEYDTNHDGKINRNELLPFVKNFNASILIELEKEKQKRKLLNKK